MLLENVCNGEGEELLEPEGEDKLREEVERARTVIREAEEQKRRSEQRRKEAWKREEERERQGDKDTMKGLNEGIREMMSMMARMREDQATLAKDLSRITNRVQRTEDAISTQIHGHGEGDNEENDGYNNWHQYESRDEDMYEEEAYEGCSKEAKGEDDI